MLQGYPPPILNYQSLLGEGPVWDVRRQRLLWVDILQGHIHSYYPITGEHGALQVGDMVGAVALRESGGLVAALRSGFHFVDEVSGDRTFIQNPEAHVGGNRFNDGKCDPEGRFWAGTMSLDDIPEKAALYTLEVNGAVRQAIRPVSISNGLAWNRAGDTMYYIDTPTHEVAAFDYDGATGAVSGRRVVVSIPKDSGAPDGMTIDTEGMLWIAHWDGWRVTRWNPATGEQTGRIELPTARVTSCTFGGKDLGDLYITTARGGLSEEELKKQPLAGSVFVVKASGYRGLEPSRYRG